jgi:hypothetical protein
MGFEQENVCWFITLSFKIFLVGAGFLGFLWPKLFLITIT